MNKVVTITGATIDVPDADDISLAKTWIIRRMWMVLLFLATTGMFGVWRLSAQSERMRSQVEANSARLDASAQLQSELIRASAKMDALSDELTEVRKDIRELRQGR